LGGHAKPKTPSESSTAMIYQLPILPAFLLISMLLMGAYWVGTTFSTRFPESNKKRPTFFVEGSLLSLLIGLTFSLSASKYDRRRADFNDEINAISTTIYRVRMHPDIAVRERLNTSLSAYLENRIAYYEVGSDQDRIDSVLSAGDALAVELFDLVATASLDAGKLAFTQQMVPALNAMFDASGTREIFRTARIPSSVINLLVFLSMVVAFLNGSKQEQGRIRWIPALGYTILIAMSFGLIIDLGHNRSGRIHLDREQQRMIQLREMFE
jgi:hypothetical protein